MVSETQNLLTLQYTVHSKIPFNRNSHHTETSHLQCIANQLNGFNRHSKFNPTRSEHFLGLIGWGVHWTRKILNMVNDRKIILSNF